MGSDETKVGGIESGEQGKVGSGECADGPAHIQEGAMCDALTCRSREDPCPAYDGRGSLRAPGDRIPLLRSGRASKQRRRRARPERTRASTDGGRARWRAARLAPEAVVVVVQLAHAHDEHLSVRDPRCRACRENGSDGVGHVQGRVGGDPRRGQGSRWRHPAPTSSGGRGDRPEGHSRGLICPSRGARGIATAARRLGEGR